MEDDQQFCLRWNNHQTTLIQNFDTLLESGTLVDCTLAAEGKYLKAHKVVLSACSPYFEGLLSEHYDKHPVFILKDVKFKELKAMMDYMYRGEVNISQDQLAALLKAAESLQIKGLSESRTGGNGCTKPDTRQSKVSSQSTAPSLDIPHASSGLTIEKNSKVPRQSLAQSSVGDLPEDSASPSIPKGISSREGSQSPVSRKRKRLRRRSVGEDNSIENHESNSSDMTQQPVPALGVAPVADEKSHADAADSLGRSALMQQLTKPADEMLQLPVEKPEPTEDMIQPKSEYLDDPEESVEDLTLDDDMNDLNEMEDSNRAGPSSHDPNQHPGLAAWHVTGDRSNAGGVVGSVAGGPGAQDEVFLAAHEAVQAQRDSQDYENFDFYSDWNFPAGALEPLTEVTTAGEEDCDNCFECSRCNKAYKTLKSLRRHRFHCGRTFDPLVRGFVQNYEENDDQAQFQCVYCNRAYRWKKGLKRHQQRCEIKMAQENQSENNLEVDIIEESNDDNSRGGNPEEPEIDITAEDDEIEIADSPPPSPSTSEQNRKSSSSSSLIVRNRDATIGRFQCILCGKKYGWLKNLRRHQRICRKKTNKHRWKECKVMIEPLPLKSSKRIAEQNFKCSNCFEQFKWLRDLRQHQTNCMKKAQNSWNVSEAKKSSKKQSNLQEKQGGHSSENSNQEDVDQLYKCAFCLKEYKWRRSLRRHYPKCTERGDLSLNVLKE